MKAWLLWLALVPSPVRAADGELMTWEDCVSVAMRLNPDLGAASLGRDAGRSGYLGSFSGLLPQLSLSNSFSDSYSAGPTTQHWSAQGTLSMRLFDAARLADIRSASASYDRASAALRQTSTDLRFNLRRAFLQLLFSQEAIEVSRRIAAMRRRGSELVTLRYDSGRESRGNMLRAQAQLLQAEADLAQAERDLRTARRSVDRQLGYDEFKAVTATGTWSASQPPELPGDVGALVSKRPDVQAQQASIRGAQAGLESARGSLWPALSASYSRTAAGRTEFPSGALGWSALGTLSIPLFGGGPTAVYHGVSGAKSGLERSRQDLRSVRNAAAADLEGAWSDFARASAQARVQAALLEAARQRNEEADIRYASGLLSYDNWEIISSDRISQERQSLQSKVNASIGEAGWERALGRGLGE